MGAAEAKALVFGGVKVELACRYQAKPSAVQTIRQVLVEMDAPKVRSARCLKTYMKFFTSHELKALTVIFGILLLISIPNFAVSIKRARDVTRKSDIRDLAEAANAYQKKYFVFPDKIEPLSEFLKAVPRDPQAGQGLVYVYISNGRRYQILAALEDKNQDEYDQRIEQRNISCGTRICNFGRAYGKTPLDVSLEEYEKSLYPR